MARELAYAIITPYTIRKSRTGAIVARLLSRANSRLVAAQMVGLTADMAARYAASIKPGSDPQDEKCRQMIRNYILQNLSPAPDGRPHRSLILMFCGENARADIAAVVGHLSISSSSGESIRDGYGDLVCDEDGSVRYFEPAVLISETGPQASADEIDIWLDFLKSQPNLLENVCEYDNPDRVQQTLVLIKPDSWRERSARPGAIIDMFSRTGLRIIGCKLCRMSVNQALEFYGPVEEVLCRKLSPGIGRKAKQVLEDKLQITLPPELEETLATEVGIPFACDQFERIIEFMTGWRPSQCPPEQCDELGRVRSLALVYEGDDAVSKIRDVLGPTDPTKAPDGTVRREFGSDVMVNTAHASDSPENAQREMGILKLRDSNFIQLVENAMSELPASK